MKDEVRRYLRKAEHALKVAEDLLKSSVRQFFQISTVSDGNQW